MLKKQFYFTFFKAITAFFFSHFHDSMLLAQEAKAINSTQVIHKTVSHKENPFESHSATTVVFNFTNLSHSSQTAQLILKKLVEELNTAEFFNNTIEQFYFSYCNCIKKNEEVTVHYSFLKNPTEKFNKFVNNLNINTQQQGSGEFTLRYPIIPKNGKKIQKEKEIYPFSISFKTSNQNGVAVNLIYQYSSFIRGLINLHTNLYNPTDDAIFKTSNIQFTENDSKLTISVIYSFFGHVTESANKEEQRKIVFSLQRLVAKLAAETK